jgi:hypothetical protein
MGRFIDWLEQRPSWSQYFKLIAYIFVFEIIWTTILVLGMHYAHIPEPKIDPEFEAHIRKIINLPLGVSGLYFMVVAFVEESVFRLGPLFIAMALFRWLALTKPLIVVTLLLSSLMFRIVHLGNFDVAKMGTATFVVATVMTVVFQGLGGFLYGMFFLKYSWGAFWTCIVMHAVWDTGLVAFDKVFG